MGVTRIIPPWEAMVGSGTVFVEVWKVALLLALVILIWKLSTSYFKRLEWTAENYQKRRVPYSLGVILLAASIMSLFLGASTTFVLYIITIWLAGWIDDFFGSSFPKGIRGHMMYFVQRGEWTTGLMKIIFISAAALFAVVSEIDLILGWESIISLFIFVLSPHVTNILDTRPLRVWKWTFCHFLIYFIMIPSLQGGEVIVFVLAMMIIWWHIEKTKQAMLGDNGAALVGGIIAWFGFSTLPFIVKIVIVLLYTVLTLMAERISFHETIQQSRLLKWIDQLGWKEI
ncbi:hypothetical protein [Salibacterium salarium]|uniref:hypothetical protein n=1 Tax=Salibacterium salarium TaxID=284579 RepID=UPI000F78B693|nr:hypothetical protein [Salibacterium salarium]